MTSPVVEDLRAAASQLGESGVWDSYYDCVATRLGFSDYEPHELLGAVYEVLRPEHGVAALCAESVRAARRRAVPSGRSLSPRAAARRP